MSGKAILIAGGYGVVGSRIAAELAPDYPDRVIVAGRNLERADATAAAIGHGVRGRELDVTAPSSIAAALDDVAVVVSCIDQPQRGLLHAAIEHGLRYTNITPHLTELGRGAAYERIDAAARASGALVLLGAGLVPGISSVMVRAVTNTLGGADAIETALLLSAGDATGPASFDYFLQELTMPFDVHVDGADRPARAFSDPRSVDFPSPVGPRLAYLFPFSDQVLYPRTMHARTARTRLALDPPRLARLLAALVRTGAARVVAREHVRRAIVRRRRDRTARPDAPFALRVDVTHGGHSSYATLVGHVQADATAAGTVGLVRSISCGNYLTRIGPSGGSSSVSIVSHPGAPGSPGLPHSAHSSTPQDWLFAHDGSLRLLSPLVRRGSRPCSGKDRRRNTNRPHAEPSPLNHAERGVPSCSCGSEAEQEISDGHPARGQGHAARPLRPDP